MVSPGLGILIFCTAVAGISGCVWAESAVLKDVEFSITSDVGIGNEVCVTGTHPALGGGDPLRAPKLAWNPGNVWKGHVALEAGTNFSYRMISRNYSTGSWGNPSNVNSLGSIQTMTTPSHIPPPWKNKVVFYRTQWTAPHVLFRDKTHNGAWTDRVLRVWGAGRVAGEKTFIAEDLAPSGCELEFVFHNGAGTYDNAPAPPSGTAQGAAPAVPVPYQGLVAPYNYRTRLDVLLVQDGGVFNYLPTGTISAPRFETRQVASTAAGIPGRPIRILLPRGYDQNMAKRYPVVLFHDGQNVFFPGGPFGAWDADRIAGYETGQGRMREAILVSVPNGNDYGSNRLNEYLPDGDTIPNYLGQSYTGRAAAYARFLLDNVLPTLDFNYRTLGDAANTFTVGSSMGGLVSDFLGFSYPSRFGAAGIFSPAYWAAPNWVVQRDAAVKLPVRRYLYMGTAESSSGESSSNVYWQGALQAYNAWLRAGHPVHRDLLFEGGNGATHSETAWALRLPSFFAFALDPWREANPLSLEAAPPTLAFDALHFSANQAELSFIARFGMTQTLWESDQLANWQEIQLPGEEEWWNLRGVTRPVGTLGGPVPSKKYWKVENEAWPSP